MISVSNKYQMIIEDDHNGEVMTYETSNCNGNNIHEKDKYIIIKIIYQCLTYI